MAVASDAGRENKTEPKPLTKRTVETQTIYRRRPEVEAQIREILSLMDNKIFERLQAVNGEPRFLKSETLVYLLRESFLAENDELFNRIYETISKRIFRLLIGRKTKFQDSSDFEDFLQDCDFSRRRDEKVFRKAEAGKRFCVFGRRRGGR